MSWAEVKKSINSDLNTPLNDRFGCVFDIYPRGMKLKTATGNAGNQSEPSSVFEIANSSGYITSIRSVANQWSSYYTSGTVEVILDHTRHYIVKSSYYGNVNVTATLNVSLSDDMISSPYQPDEDITVERGDQSITVNFPLHFKNHMEIRVIEATTSNPGMVAWGWAVDYMIETGGA